MQSNAVYRNDVNVQCFNNIRRIPNCQIRLGDESYFLGLIRGGRIQDDLM